MKASPRAVGAILGFAGTVALVSADAAPFVEGAGRLVPFGIAGLLVLGAVAGLLANDGRTWAGLIGGVFAAAILYLLGRIAFNFLTGPSLTPVDEWRVWLFVSLVGTVVLVSVGLAIGRLLRGWRPAVAWPRGALAAGPLGIVSLALSGAIALGFATTNLVLQPDARILTVRVTQGGLELSPAAVSEGMYHVIVESSASSPWAVSMVSANFSGPADEALPFGSQGLDLADADAWFEGDWMNASGLTPPRYHVDGAWMAEPGTRDYGGELSFSLEGPGRNIIWYTAAPGRTAGSENMAGVPWPPEDRAFLTLVD